MNFIWVIGRYKIWHHGTKGRKILIFLHIVEENCFKSKTIF